MRMICTGTATSLLLLFGPMDDETFSLLFGGGGGGDGVSCCCCFFANCVRNLYGWADGCSNISFPFLRSPFQRANRQRGWMDGWCTSYAVVPVAPVYSTCDILCYKCCVGSVNYLCRTEWLLFPHKRIVTCSVFTLAHTHTDESVPCLPFWLVYSVCTHTKHTRKSIKLCTPFG